MENYAKRLLQQRDIKQKDLARWLKINGARISLILSGKGQPTASEKRKLEDFFGLPIEALLSGFEDEESLLWLEE